MLYPKGQGKAFSLNVGCLEIKIKFGFHWRQHKPLFQMNHSPQIHMENFLKTFCYLYRYNDKETKTIEKM